MKPQDVVQETLAEVPRRLRATGNNEVGRPFEAVGTAWKGRPTSILPVAPSAQLATPLLPVAAASRRQARPSAQFCSDALGLAEGRFHPPRRRPDTTRIAQIDRVRRE
jgi:hypothetical protein